MGKVLLVTGVAGTGKSTLEKLFREKGYATNDLDKGFASWQHIASRQPVTSPINQPASWYETHDWFTEKERLITRINEFRSSPDPLLLFGNTADLDSLHELFDTIFVLEYSDETTIHDRISNRTGNPYGKDPVEFAALLSYYEPMQKRFRKVGAIPIDCTLPIKAIIEKIENAV